MIRTLARRSSVVYRTEISCYVRIVHLYSYLKKDTKTEMVTMIFRRNTNVKEKIQHTDLN